MDQLLPSTYYHIYNHANGDEDLFREPENYHYFLQQYHKHIDAIADTYCFCLMPNHFHLLARIKPKEAITAHLPGFKNLEGVEASNYLSKKFSNFFNGYTKAFNKKYERRGSLFLKNFKKKAIFESEYLASVILYIHLNPVKHAFVKNPADWKWSSYDTFHIDRLSVVEALFKTEENYFRAYEDKINSYEEYDQIESYFLQ
ncbi:MAG: transposase [Bacteroidota bacterium]|nr:transposase [Bacteroidota bacterium]